MKDKLFLDEEIKVARESQIRSLSLSKRIENLEKIVLEVKNRTSQLETQYLKEARDVEKLTSLSFTNFISTLLKNKEGQLEKEEYEAYEAKKKWDAMKFEVYQLEKELEELVEQKDIAQKGADLYPGLIREKMEWMRANGSVGLDHMTILEHNALAIGSQLREVEEAISAVKEALVQSHGAVELLQKAKDWSHYDLLGGGVLATMMKRDRMDQAKNQMDLLNHKVKKMSKELKEVDFESLSEVDFKSMRVMDYIFDGFFVDLGVHNQIKEALETLSLFEIQSKKILEKLRLEALRLKSEEESNEKTLCEWVASAH